MNPTKIEWCDFTWNPVTGCKHGCKYCYARKMAERFKFASKNHPAPTIPEFSPIFYSSRLGQPAKRKKPSRIFVVSMGDLFGSWVPDSWIEKVFKACEAAPQHTYYFLTKNPKRYEQFEDWFYVGDNARKNVWSGASVTSREDINKVFNEFAIGSNDFLSIEPYLIELDSMLLRWYDWIIVGSETRNGKPVNMPKREWIIDIRKQCAALNIPLFEKNSLAPLKLPGGLIQQWPKAKD